MKAARIHRYGTPDELVIDEVPDPPCPSPDAVLVDVHASSVNPVDCKIRTGYHRAVVRLELPAILGLDVSGVVSAVGDKVTKYQVGDEVFSSPHHSWPGAYAEKMWVPEAHLAPKPKRLSHEQAAALPLVGLTAWDCLVTAIDLQPDDKVFIQAGSGGVGHIAIQLAKHLGATVATTCSGRNAEFVQSLGADQVIDYTQQRYDEVLSDQDAALETLGGVHIPRTLKVLRKGGICAAITSGLPERSKAYGPVLGAVFTGVALGATWVDARVLRGKRFKAVVRRPDGEALAQLGELVDRGVVTPHLDQVFDLADIAEAHRLSESGRVRGKIAIRVKA